MNAADLLARYAARRDAEAFAELVRDYQSMVVATCRRRLAAPGDVDDAVQETFLKLAGNAGALRANVAAWLHRCATNVSTDLNRRRATRRRHESAAAIAEVAGDASRELAELREHLDAALGRLDESQRELILQRFFVGRSQVDLAAEANVSPGAMSQRVDRAVAALRNHLAASGAVAASAALVDALSAEHASAQAVAPALTAKLNAIGLSGAPATGGLAAGTAWSALAAAALLGVAAAALWWGTRPATSIVATTTAPTTQAGGGLTVRPDANQPTSPVTPDWRGPITADGALSGRITDSDNKPIANATVGLAGTRERATADGDGVYRFATIPRDGDYQLTVDADGFVTVDAYVSGRDTLRLSRNARAVRNVVLQRAHLVTVLVDDAAGAPLGDDVNVSYLPVVSGSAEQRWRAIERPAYRKRGEDAITIALPIGPTPYAIMAGAKDHAPAFAIVAPATAEASNVTITLDSGVGVSGIATCNDGKPAAGWEVSVQPKDWPSSSGWIPHAKIDEAGRFTLTHVARGTYDVGISIPTGGGGSTGRTLGTFELDPAKPLALAVPMTSPGSLATIRGKLNWQGDTTAKDVAYGMTVEAVGIADARRYMTLIDTSPKTRPDAFEIANVEPGEYTITFRGVVEPVTLAHVKVPGHLPDVTLRAARKSAIAGVVIDEATGKPVTNFAYRVKTLGYSGSPTEWTQVGDENGAFAAEPGDAGEYRVQISAGGYAWRWSDVVKIEASGAIATTAIKLSRGGALRGAVLDPNGRPVAGARVIPFSYAQSDAITWDGAIGRFASEAGAAVTDANGRYELDHLGVGDEALKIVHPDFAPGVVWPARVVFGQASEAPTATLHVGAGIVGTIYDADGKPAPGIGVVVQSEISFDPDDANVVSRATSDAAGHYRVDHLPPQTLYVLADRTRRREGVAFRIARPFEGHVTTLDFGGANVLTGRIVGGGGRPRAIQRLSIAVGDDQVTSLFQAYATLAADGRFAFTGLPPGRYTLFAAYENDPFYRAFPLRVVTIDGSATQDLGDVVDDRGRVSLRVVADDPADVPDGVVLTFDPDVVGHDMPFARFRHEGDRWICDDVPAGRSIVQASGKTGGTLAYATVDRAIGQAEQSLTLALPKRSGTLHVIAATRPMQAIAKVIDAHGASWAWLGYPDVTDVRVPPGTYRVTAGFTQRPRADVAPIDVAAGETRDVALTEPAPVTANVRFWSADGTLRTDVDVTLVDSIGTTVAPVPGLAIEPFTFPVVPGRYTARIARRGTPIVERPIDVGSPPPSAWTSPVTCDVVLPE